MFAKLLFLVNCLVGALLNHGGLGGLRGVDEF